MANLADMSVEALTVMIKELRENIASSKEVLRTVLAERARKENLEAAAVKLNELRSQYGVQTLAALGVPSGERVGGAGAG